MKDLTRGRIDAHLWRMSGAFLLNMSTGALFSLANIYWLGELGARAQAAVTLAGIPVMLLLTCSTVVGMGAGILVSHAVGAGDRDRANRIFNEAFGASLIAIAAIGAVAWVYRDAFAALMTNDPGTAALMATYFEWFVPSIVVQLPLFVLAVALEFTGNLRAATIAQTGMVALNAVLVPVLMFGWLGVPRLGIAGAGLAAFVACGLAMLGLVGYSLRRRAYLRLRPSLWLVRPVELWNALKIGLPTGIESGLVAAYLLVIALLLRPFDPAEQAAFGIGHRLFQAALMPLMALSSAICVIVGQSHGAGMPGRVRETLRVGLAIGLLVAPALLLVIEGFAPRICSAFTDDPAAIVAGTEFLRIGALTLIPSAIAYIVFGTLSGMGHTRASLYAQIVYAALVAVPAWALSHLAGFAPEWLWATMVVAGCAQAAMAWYFLRRHFRRETERPSASSVAEIGATP